jgi:predicted aminopeptidase
MMRRELRRLLIDAMRNWAAAQSEKLDLPDNHSFEYRRDVAGGAVVVIHTPHGDAYYNLKIIEMTGEKR